MTAATGESGNNPSSQKITPQPPVVTGDFIKIFLAFHLFMLTISMFNLLPHFLELRGASEGLYGAVAGSSGLVSFVCIILLGHTADRWSRKAAVSFYMLFALGGNAVAILAMHQPMEWYFLSRMFHGVMMALGFPIVFAWVVEITPSARRHESLAWIGIAALIANTTGPLIAEGILTVQGLPVVADSYRMVFYVSTFLLIFALGVFFFVKNSRAPEGDQVSQGLLHMLRAPGALLTLLLAMSFGGVFGVIISFGKNYVESVGLNYVTVLFGSYTVGAIMSRVFIRVLSRRFSPPMLISIGLTGVAVGIFTLALAQNYPLLSLSGFFYGVSHGILYPTLFMRFLQAQAESGMGRASILFQGAFAAGIGLAPYLGGILVQHTSFPVLFTVLGIISLSVIPLAWGGKGREIKGA